MRGVSVNGRRLPSEPKSKSEDLRAEQGLPLEKKAVSL